MSAAEEEKASQIAELTAQIEENINRHKQQLEEEEQRNQSLFSEAQKQHSAALEAR